MKRKQRSAKKTPIPPEERRITTSIRLKKADIKAAKMAAELAGVSRSRWIEMAIRGQLHVAMRKKAM